MTQDFLERVGVVIPTLNAGPRWAECLSAMAIQSLQPRRRLVVDSASTDDTVALAKAAGFEVVGIAREEFNHGGTRQWAAEYLIDCEIIVYLTQDAILADADALKELVRCFQDLQVAVAYGRQIPHKNAKAIEAHARRFNYGEISLRKCLADIRQLGCKVFFCSNSFAAYRRTKLLELGGFRRDLILEEDAEFAARAVRAGYANAYCATARIHHSHDYTIRQQLYRYFDIGAFDARCRWMREQFGSHKGEGFRFVKSELRYLLDHAPVEIPRALLHTAAKLAGYRLGLVEAYLPNSLKRRLSMLPGYWDRGRPA